MVTGGRGAASRQAPPAVRRTLTCGYCGATFEEDRTQATCRACPLGKACGYVRCPACGYENPRAPGWLNRIREWWTQ